MHVAEGIGLAMTRLAIVGGNQGRQPIWNEDKSIVIVCNGEIYNHALLRTALEQGGHGFSTLSDVEVIVHLYEQHGEDCLEYLEGIFAFALWDSVKEKLFVARDRCGVKPLYYTETKGGLMFCSEFKTLLHQTMEDVETAADDTALASDDTALPLDDRTGSNRTAGYRLEHRLEYRLSAYNAFRFVPAPHTIAKKIFKLRPGECMTVENGVIRSRMYWQPTPKRVHGRVSARVPALSPVKSLKQQTVELRHQLMEATLSQATSDVKTGILLSGGLDSSSLLGMYNALFGEAPQTYTVAFTSPNHSTDTKEYSEMDEAAEVARAFGAEHITDRITPRQALEALPNIVRALDEPIADPTAIPLWFAVRLARQAGAKVVYSGEGMDELFAGYSVYRQIHWLNALRKFPPALRKATLALASQFNLPGQGVLKRSLLPPSEWYHGVGGAFSDTEVRRLYLKGTEDAGNFSAQDYVRQAMSGVGHESLLTQMTYFDLQAWLAEDTLVKSDKISMAHSIELRVPFLNHSVVDFALSLPDSVKMRRGLDKQIVREAMTGIVPDFVLRRKKNGFPIPLTAWIFGEWKEFAWSSLCDSSASVRGIYKLEELDRLFQEGELHPAHRSRTARLIWTLLSFELWYQYVVEGQAIQESTPSDRVTMGEESLRIRKAAP